MPTHVKTMLSLLVLAVAAAGYVFQEALGQEGPKYAVAFLGAFMVIAMWVFPEVQRRKGDKV